MTIQGFLLEDVMGVSIEYWIDCDDSKMNESFVDFFTTEYSLERYGNNINIFFEEDYGLSSDNRWNTFINEFTHQSPNYVRFASEAFEFIREHFVQNFGSTKAIFIADSCFELHGKIEDLLGDGTAFEEILKTLPEENIISLNKEYSQEELKRIEENSSRMIFIYEF